jgi:hypothetical protein
VNVVASFEYTGVPMELWISVYAISRMIVPDKRASGAKGKVDKAIAFQIHTTFCADILRCTRHGFDNGSPSSFRSLWTEEIVRLQSLLEAIRIQRGANRDMCRGGKVVSGQGRKGERTKIDVNDEMDGWMDGYDMI